MYQNSLDQANRKNGEHDIRVEGMGWKRWATVNLNLCDAEAAADIIREGKRLFGANNVAVETVIDKRWEILVRTADRNYMDP